MTKQFFWSEIHSTWNNKWCVKLLVPETLKKLREWQEAALGWAHALYRRCTGGFSMYIHPHSHPNRPVVCNTADVHYFNKTLQDFWVVCFVERLSHKSHNLDYFNLCVFKFLNEYKIVALFFCSFLEVPVGNDNHTCRVSSYTYQLYI